MRQALWLVLTGDAEVARIAWVSLKCSIASTVVATLIGIPIGFVVGSRIFRGKNGVIAVINTLMALPTVVVGLTLYFLFSRHGPLGPANLLYTQTAIIVGEFVLACPIIASLTISAIHSVGGRVAETAKTLGVSGWLATRAVLWEARFGIMAAIIAGFGRVVAELGVAMMLGGNIRGYTRTLTTTIALETGRGEFGLALALGFVLLALALGVNVMMNVIQRRGD